MYLPIGHPQTKFAILEKNLAKSCEFRYAENSNTFIGDKLGARISSAYRSVSALFMQGRAEDSRRFPRHEYLDLENSQHTHHRRYLVQI